MEFEDGPVIYQHDFPDAIQHYYRASGMDEDVNLYEGEFSLDGIQGYVGNVRWTWRPRAAIEVSGTRETSSSDLLCLLRRGDGKSMWAKRARLEIELPRGDLPEQPAAPLSSLVNRGVSRTASVEEELGDPSELERVTFFIANGWDGGGTGVCDPHDLQHVWHGRIETLSGGWRVIIDHLPEMNRRAWRELRDQGGYRFTHVGQLSLAEGSVFSGVEAFTALDRVRLGLNLALGRRVTCALPVGWRGGKAVWSRWRTAPVDPFESLGSGNQWLDETVVDDQVRDVVSAVLTFTADEADRAALKSALRYHVAANVDADVELSVPISVSGLQLLAYYRFVSQRRAYSKGAWQDLSTEEQLRLLLDDASIDTAIASQFRHLSDLRDHLANNAPPRDALGVIIKMRNVVTHPSRGTPADFSIYAWGEAAILARYWLCLALLNTVGYRGKIAAVLQGRARYVGELRDPPWVEPSTSEKDTVDEVSPRAPPRPSADR